MKIQLDTFVDKEELNKRLFEKLHKREFDKHFDRLNSTCSYLETRVKTAIPSINEDIKTKIKSKAEQRDLEDLNREKASNSFVE